MTWLFYDGECPFCIASTAKLGPLLRRLNIGVAPLQDAWVRQKLASLGRKEMPGEMILLDNDQLIGGADAIVAIARRRWWGRPLAFLARIPGVMPLLRRAYAWVALHRLGLLRQRCDSACVPLSASSRHTAR